MIVTSMTVEERNVQRLNPVLQRRMARLSLKGWRFTYCNNSVLTIWRAVSPVTGLDYNRPTLPDLIEHLVGYDA